MTVSLFKPYRPCHAVVARVGVLGSPAICSLPNGHDGEHVAEQGFCGGVVKWSDGADVRFHEETGRVYVLPVVKPCSAVHPIALHDDHTNIVCTLPVGHDGDHEDHRTVETDGCIACWQDRRRSQL